MQSHILFPQWLAQRQKLTGGRRTAEILLIGVWICWDVAGVAFHGPGYLQVGRNLQRPRIGNLCWVSILVVPGVFSFGVFATGTAAHLSFDEFTK